MNRADAVRELKLVYTILRADLDAAGRGATENPSAFHKRTLVRTCAALVEGLSYQLRRVTLASLQSTSHLTPGELAILRETTYRLSDKGTVEERDNFQQTLAMLLFSLRVYAKNHGAVFVPDTSDNGWSCLRKAMALRDRLMHPKSVADLTVSDEEGADFAAGIKWWDDAVADLLAACDAADKEFLAKESTR
jgi:hypothetical protein